MQKRVCNSQFGFVRPATLITTLVLILLTVWLWIRWQPERVIRRNQEALITAIENRKGGKLKRLLAESYRDQWNLNREDVVTALLDVGSQFFLLNLDHTEPVLESMESGSATVTVEFEASGSGSPIAHEVIRRCNRLKEPFVFVWEKQSFWPSSWKVTRIENSDLPDELYGYKPGDIGRAIRSGGTF